MPVFPVLPLARHIGFSIQVTFCTWPVVPALLMSNCLPHSYKYVYLWLYGKRLIDVCISISISSILCRNMTNTPTFLHCFRCVTAFFRQGEGETIFMFPAPWLKRKSGLSFAYFMQQTLVSVWSTQGPFQRLMTQSYMRQGPCSQEALLLEGRETQTSHSRTINTLPTGTEVKNKSAVGTTGETMTDLLGTG